MGKGKPIAPMPIAERAKIFAPFAALKGLPEALREKEKIRVPKKELSEYMENKINRVLAKVKTGTIVTIIYYDKEERQYVQLTGVVAELLYTQKNLKVNGVKIHFEDIYEIILA